MWQKYPQSTYRKPYRDVYNGVTGLYHELVSFMEDEEILDPFNQLDLAVIYYVFLPPITNKLDAWRQAWSKHRIRTIKTSPICLWVSGQMNSTSDDDLGPKQLLHYDVEGVAGGNSNEIANNGDPTFCSSTE